MGKSKPERSSLKISADFDEIAKNFPLVLSSRYLERCENRRSLLTVKTAIGNSLLSALSLFHAHSYQTLRTLIVCALQLCYSTPLLNLKFLIPTPIPYPLQTQTPIPFPNLCPVLFQNLFLAPAPNLCPTLFLSQFRVPFLNPCPAQRPSQFPAQFLNPYLIRSKTCKTRLGLVTHLLIFYFSTGHAKSWDRRTA